MAPPSGIDGLFQLPLAEYTAARNALAGSLKAAGRTEDAIAVKALPKPSLCAWTVNQLYWHHRRAFSQLMAAGERLRHSQALRLAGRGNELRPPIEAHQAALAAATRRAAALLRNAGHTPTPELTRRITTTLEALASGGGQPSAPDGRLTRDVDLPGFEAVAALVPRGGDGLRGTGLSRIIPFRQRAEPSRQKKLDADGRRRERQGAHRARRLAATAAFRDAERTVRDVRQVAAQAESALKAAAARVKAAEQTTTALEKRLEKAAAGADAARQAARRVAAAAEEAAQAIADAERTRAEARRALDALS